MPDLEHTLQGHDLGFLKIVAGAWGIELNAPDAVSALPIIVQRIIEHADFAEIIEALPKDSKEVLQVLVQNEGRISWAAFVRKESAFDGAFFGGPAREPRLELPPPETTSTGRTPGQPSAPNRQEKAMPRQRGP